MTASSSRPRPRSSRRSTTRTLTMNGVSKAYAMTGWRIGYGGGPEPLIKAMAKIQSQSTSNPIVDLAMGGGRGAERPAGLHPEERRDLPAAPRPGGLDAQPGQGHLPARGRRAPSTSSRRAPGRSARPTPAASKIGNDEDFVTALLEEEGVAVVHGSAFGLAPLFPHLLRHRRPRCWKTPAAASSASARGSDRRSAQTDGRGPGTSPKERISSTWRSGFTRSRDASAIAHASPSDNEHQQKSSNHRGHSGRRVSYASRPEFSFTPVLVTGQ